MRTFILNTINQIPATNRQLDYKSTLKTNEWIVFTGSEGEVEKFLFMDDEELLVSVNGKTTSSKWQFMKVNSSLIIDDGINKYMFKVIVCSKDIVFLNVDSTNSYSFLINTKSKALKDAGLRDIKFFLMNNFNIDLFDDQEREVYNETKKEIERKKQEEKDRKSKNVLKWFGSIAAIIICFFLVSAIVEGIIEKRQQKEEYERRHPKMKVTRKENRQVVDLGLSVNWAMCDIGANLPKETGNMYGWGDTLGITYEEHIPMFNDVRCVGMEYVPEHGGKFAYPTRIEKEPPITIVGTQYDVAKQCWGDKWRMPTRAEAQELIDSCEFVGRNNYIAVIGPSGDSILFHFPVNWNYHEYATGELDTVVFLEDRNCCVYSFILMDDRKDLFGKMVPVAKMSHAERSKMLSIRAVFEK